MELDLIVSMYRMGYMIAIDMGILDVVKDALLALAVALFPWFWLQLR
jgi:hypothetical protein